MTGFVDREFEDQEEESGQGQGESARALFARTVSGARPHLGFSAEDMVLQGRRRVRRRRVAAVVGSTASVAAVAVAATAFAGGARSGAATSAEGVTSASTSSYPTTPTTAPSSAAKLLTDDERTTVEKNLAAAVFAKVIGELDPGVKHFAIQPLPHSPTPYTPNSGMCIEKTKVQIAYSFVTDWTADGKDPFPRTPQAVSPYLQVMVTIYAPGQAVDQFSDTKDWGSIASSQLSDGSVLRTASGAGGHRVQAVRTMPDQQEIVLSAIDSAVDSAKDKGAPPNQPTNPFPFSVAQLAGVVSGLSLPLPFADGFQPHAACGAF